MNDREKLNKKIDTFLSINLNDDTSIKETFSKITEENEIYESYLNQYRIDTSTSSDDIENVEESNKKR